jgi:hypothetical protein
VLCFQLFAHAVGRQQLIDEWNETQIAKYGSLEACPYLPKEDEGVEYKAHVALPTQEEIDKEILQKMKEV